MNNYSLTYMMILDLLFKTGKQTIPSPVYGNTIDSSGQFSRSNSGATSHKFPQPIVIANTDLAEICTSAEWQLIATLIKELKEYNILWKCDNELKNKNSTVRKAIKGLIDKGVLIKTETTNIYIVNPLHLRRGDILSVLTSTANMLIGEGKVDSEHVRNIRPVKNFTIPVGRITDSVIPDVAINS